MKKHKLMITAALALGISSGAAFSVELSNGDYQFCDGEGTWHFVNNQTGGATEPGTIDVYFNSGSQMGIPAIKVNRNTQHFYVSASGTLWNAMTNLRGRLVLSDFVCVVKCEKECK